MEYLFATLTFCNSCRCPKKRAANSCYVVV